MAQDLEANTVEAARWRLRELRETAAEDRRERDGTVSLLEDISAGLGEGLLVVGADLKLRLINPMALRFCGWEGSPPASLLEAVREPEVLEAVRSAASGETRRPVLLENPRGLWEVRPFPIRQGGAVVLLTDVGLIRKAQELRRRFVQDLSHELRSPLATLRTTIESLEGELAPEIGDVVVRQVSRIDRLASELHDLASLEVGDVELNPETVSLELLAREVADDFSPLAQASEVELRVQVDPTLTCRCDRRGLYRVLSNLVDNAIKYNRAGGWVELSGSRAGQQAELLVSDSGEGIPPGELKAVLQRFYRVDKARTPGRGGLGLGLAIVKHMIQHMGGTLALDSREGVGTQVTLRLPEADS
jgi:signal transduction histidine kinase